VPVLLARAAGPSLQRPPVFTSSTSESITSSSAAVTPAHAGQLEGSAPAGASELAVADVSDAMHDVPPIAFFMANVDVVPESIKMSAIRADLKARRMAHRYEVRRRAQLVRASVTPRLRELEDRARGSMQCVHVHTDASKPVTGDVMCMRYHCQNSRMFDDREKSIERERVLQYAGYTVRDIRC
jgi:hypothetical protein